MAREANGIELESSWADWQWAGGRGRGEALLAGGGGGRTEGPSQSALRRQDAGQSLRVT